MMAGASKLRIGLLGTSYVSTYAVIAPWQEGAQIEVAAVASRDAGRAAAFAREHGIARSFGSYGDLLDKADIDAVYVGLPNGLHGHWTRRAIAAGLPVLCEKPMAANAAEADAMVREAEGRGILLVEALHWKDHPVATRIRELVAGLGPVRRMDMRYCLPGHFLPRDNIRFSADLAGGWLMDQGCYCISLARFLCGEPAGAVCATAQLAFPGVDGGMDCALSFPDDVECRISGSMIDPGEGEIITTARIACAGGTLTLVNPFLPGANPFTAEQGARLVVERADGTAFEERADLVSSWYCQANAFAGLVRGWKGGPVPARDAAANMRVVDALYRAAGMEPRAPTACP